MKNNDFSKVYIGGLLFDNVNMDVGFVRCLGKGNKERIVPLGRKAIVSLKRYLGKERQYFLKKRSTNVLFLSRLNKRISRQSIWKMIKKYSRQARIKKPIRPHTLRHSFATHLIQNGYAVTEVQPLLGHNSLNTTIIYLHMASPELLKVKSPYDSLGNKKNEKEK